MTNKSYPKATHAATNSFSLELSRIEQQERVDKKHTKIWMIRLNDSEYELASICLIEYGNQKKQRNSVLGNVQSEIDIRVVEYEFHFAQLLLLHSLCKNKTSTCWLLLRMNLHLLSLYLETLFSPQAKRKFHLETVLKKKLYLHADHSVK